MRIAAAVYEALSPFMMEIKEDLDTVKENLTRHTQIEEIVDSLNGDLKKHKNKTTTEFADINSKLDSLNSKQDGLNMTVMTVNSELEHNVLTNITKELKEITEHNVLTNVTKELKEITGFITEYVPKLHGCGGTGGWRRVIYLDMTDPNINCPTGWQLTSHSKRTCGKVSTSSPSCDSVFFPVSGGAYTRVCGSIRAYQYGGLDAFEAYDDGQVTTIEGAYVSGISLTHGSPRQHIWTFAAGVTEASLTRDDVCPCDANTNIAIPSFVGEDYLCESGVNSGTASGRLYPDDPLWDGGGCSSSSNCCSFNNPPYFTKQLPSSTSDPIEARLCSYDDDSDDSPVEFIELYVK